MNIPACRPSGDHLKNLLKRSVELMGAECSDYGQSSLPPPSSPSLSPSLSPSPPPSLPPSPILLTSLPSSLSLLTFISLSSQSFLSTYRGPNHSSVALHGALCQYWWGIWRPNGGWVLPQAQLCLPYAGARGIYVIRHVEYILCVCSGEVSMTRSTRVGVNNGSINCCN